MTPRAPANLEAERAVLGAALLEPALLSRLVDALTAEDFYKDAHRILYAVLRDLWTRDGAADMVTVTAALAQRGELDRIGGEAALATLVEEAAAAPLLDPHAAEVREAARKRTLARVCQEAATRALDGHPSAAIFETLKRELAGLESEPDEPEQLPELLPGFPGAAWRGPFADYRDAMAGTSEAPDSVHFAALWAVAAARLRRRVWLYYAFPHYPNVFLVNFGSTGDSKTSASRQGLRLLPPDGSIRVLRGVGSAEALGDWMKQPDGDPPVSHLLAIEELSALLTRGGWEGSTLLHYLTETFDAPDVYEVPFRKNPIRVSEPTPTLLAGTTPEWFWKSMREVDFHGGFGNRLFFLSGAPKSPIAMPAKPNPRHLQRVQDALGQLGAVPVGEMSLAPAALDLWTGFYTAWKQTEQAAEPLRVAATKRTPAYALKLALVYAAFEGTAPVITEDQVAAAVRVAHYGSRCAGQLIGARRQFTHQGRCEEAVLRTLDGGHFPAWRIHQRIGGRFTAEEVTRALRALVTTGAVVPTGTTARNGLIYGRRGLGRSPMKRDASVKLPVTLSAQ